MPELKPDQLLLIAGFVLPGAISMYVYALKVPQKEFRLQDRIAEAICFSLLNFVFVWLPIQDLLGPTSLASVGNVTSFGWRSWLVLLLGFIVAPVVWPVLLIQVLRFAERLGWISVRAKTAWDDFFGHQGRGCWLQIELTDGRVVGGLYGTNSFASSYPDPGHLYIEELWKVDAEGYFSEPEPLKPGLLLRPSDYRFVRVYTGAAA